MSDEQRLDDDATCPHDDPRGRHRCPLCRVEVLAAAGQWRPKPYVHNGDPLATPMPTDFRDRVVAASAVQPTLEES